MRNSLELAVMRYALDFLMDRGFTPMTVPVLVREHAMMGTAYFPGGEDQAYKMKDDDLYLVGTAEVSLASYHYDEILDKSHLPIKSAVGVIVFVEKQVLTEKILTVFTEFISL